MRDASRSTGVHLRHRFVKALRHSASAIGVALATQACHHEPTGPKAVRLVVEPKQIAIGVGSSATVSADGVDAQGKRFTVNGVRYSTSNSAIATVSATGQITGVAVGQVQVTGSLGGLTESISVEVRQGATTFATVRVSTSDFGGSSLAVQSAFSEKTSLQNGIGRAVVSRDAAQLVLVVDDATSSLRGLALANPGAGQLQVDARSTALSLFFLTPGIGTIVPAEVGARIAAIEGLSCYADLVAKMQLRLRTGPLADALAATDVSASFRACVGVFFQQRQQSGAFYAGLAGTRVDRTGPRFSVSRRDEPTRDVAELTNNGWRYVDVYRRDFASQETPVRVAPEMRGAVPLSLGSLFTGTLDRPTTVVDQLSGSSSAENVTYWVVGPGLATATTSAPFSYSTTDVWVWSLLDYLVIPTLGVIAPGVIKSPDQLKLAITGIKSARTFPAYLRAIESGNSDDVARESANMAWVTIGLIAAATGGPFTVAAIALTNALVGTFNVTGFIIELVTTPPIVSFTVPGVTAGVVELNTQAVSVQVGGNQTILAIVRDRFQRVLAGRSVAWSSSAPAIATVSSGGVVQGVAAGTVRIRGTSGAVFSEAVVTVAGVARRSGTLEGRVYDATSNIGVPGAAITVSVNSTVVSTITTASQGNWQTSTLSGGRYRVVVNAPGYVSSEIVDQQIDGNTVAEAIPLVPTSTQAGSIAGSARNATTNSALGSPTVVELRRGMNAVEGTLIATTTTTNGGFTFANLAAGVYSVRAVSAGMVDGYRTGISVGGRVVANQDVFLSPIGAASAGRIVLTWGASPGDLDSHLTGPNAASRFHVYYSSRGSCTVVPFACLDVDVTTGRGPETITIADIRPGTYRYSVHNFSVGTSSTNTGIATSNARVDVYLNNSLRASFSPPNTPGTLWTVFDLSGTTLTPINTVSGATSPGPQPAGAWVAQNPSERKTTTKATP